MSYIICIASLISVPFTPLFLALPLLKLKQFAASGVLGLKVAYRIRQKMGGYYIGLTAKFAGTPLFPHGYQGVNISGDAVIGKRCVIFQQVTIGSNTLLHSSAFGAPVIGDDCYIGAGAKIIGKVTVGDNCRIGANAVVYKNVPPNSTVVAGGGMRIIEHERRLDNRFINAGASGIQYWDGDKFVPLDESDVSNC